MVKLVYLVMHWKYQTVLLTSVPAVKHASVESIPLLWIGVGINGSRSVLEVREYECASNVGRCFHVASKGARRHAGSPFRVVLGARKIMADLGRDSNVLHASGREGGR